MLSVGADVLRRMYSLCILDGNGKEIKACLLRGGCEGLFKELDKLKQPFAIGYEASFSYGYLHNRLRKISQCRRVAVAHPGELRLMFAMLRSGQTCRPGAPGFERKPKKSKDERPAEGEAVSKPKEEAASPGAEKRWGRCEWGALLGRERLSASRSHRRGSCGIKCRTPQKSRRAGTGQSYRPTDAVRVNGAGPNRVMWRVLVTTPNRWLGIPKTFRGALDGGSLIDG